MPACARRWHGACHNAIGGRLRTVLQVITGKGTTGATLTATAIGALAWAVFAFWAHTFLIGVKPF
jgi:hypothetical protein